MDNTLMYNYLHMLIDDGEVFFGWEMTVYNHYMSWGGKLFCALWGFCVRQNSSHIAHMLG